MLAVSVPAPACRHEHDVDGVLNLAAHNAWKVAADYDDRKGRLAGWFYKIAYHAAVDELLTPTGTAFETCAREPSV